MWVWTPLEEVLCQHRRGLKAKHPTVRSLSHCLSETCTLAPILERGRIFTWVWKCNTSTAIIMHWSKTLRRKPKIHECCIRYNNTCNLLCIFFCISYVNVEEGLRHCGIFWRKKKGKKISLSRFLINFRKLLRVVFRHTDTQNCSLPTHRHSYIGFIFSSRFIDSSWTTYR